MLVGIKDVSKILGVECSTAYGYVKNGLVPEHFIKFRDGKFHRPSKFWLKNQVEDSIAVIAMHKSKKVDQSLIKRKKPKAHAHLKNYDLASSLMRCKA